MAVLAVPEAIGPLIAGSGSTTSVIRTVYRPVVLPLGLACAVVGSALLARHGRKLGEPMEPSTAEPQP